MAMAPLSGESVGRLMKSHAALSQDWKDVEELLSASRRHGRKCGRS